MRISDWSSDVCSSDLVAQSGSDAHRMLDSWAVSHIGSAITREGMHEMGFAVTTALPADWRTGRFVGRVDRGGGPCVILIRDGRANDITRTYPTVSAFAAAGAPDCDGEELGAIDTLGLAVPAIPRLLRPIALQCANASGVPFAVSSLEPATRATARGDP